MNDHRQRRLTAGIILIVVGVSFFVIQRFDNFRAEYFLVVMGLVFLTAYFLRKRYGLLVPGGILLGLGLGQVMDGVFRSFGNGELLGLGLGFVSIYVIALIYERRSHWWPLIPGAALVLTGIDKTDDLIEYIFDNWPLVLVVIGVLMIIGGLRKGSGAPASPPAP